MDNVPFYGPITSVPFPFRPSDTSTGSTRAAICEESSLHFCRARGLALLHAWLNKVLLQQLFHEYIHRRPSPVSPRLWRSSFSGVVQAIQSSPGTSNLRHVRLRSLALERKVMARTFLLHICLVLASLLLLTDAQRTTNATATFQSTASLRSNTTATSMLFPGSTVFVTSTPAQATINSTTVIYQYPNSTSGDNSLLMAPVTPSPPSSASSSPRSTPKVQSLATATAANLIGMLLMTSLAAILALFSR